MPKTLINKREYKELKKLTGDGFKWIARDEDGDVWVYVEKPIKVTNGIWYVVNSEHSRAKESYGFVKGENKEPTLIEELIEEYEIENGLITKQYEITEASVIPQFISNFIEEHKQYTLLEVLDKEWLCEYHEDVAEWLYNNTTVENKKREELIFALRLGYLVKKEPKYYIVNKNGNAILVWLNDKPTPDKGQFPTNFKGQENYMFTEQEIKDYDKRYVPFMVPVLNGKSPQEKDCHWAFREQVEEDGK